MYQLKIKREWTLFQNGLLLFLLPSCPLFSLQLFVWDRALLSNPGWPGISSQSPVSASECWNKGMCLFIKYHAILLLLKAVSTAKEGHILSFLKRNDPSSSFLTLLGRSTVLSRTQTTLTTQGKAGFSEGKYRPSLLSPTTYLYAGLRWRLEKYLCRGLVKRDCKYRRAEPVMQSVTSSGVMASLPFPAARLRWKASFLFGVCAHMHVWCCVLYLLTMIPFPSPS